MSNIKRSIEKTKSGKIILQVEVDAADIVTSLETKLDEVAKSLTFYREHECGTYDSMERGEFHDYWKEHVNDEFKEALTAVDTENKWKRNKNYNEFGNILISERPVHFVNLEEEFCEEYDLRWTEWVIPLVAKDSDGTSASEDSDKSASEDSE